MPNKADTLKSIRSAHFARTNYPAIEERGFFVAIASAMATVIEKAQAKNPDSSMTGDPAAIRRWLAERDQLVIESTVERATLANATVSFDSLFAAIDNAPGANGEPNH
jgi:hypothetical protein